MGTILKDESGATAVEYGFLAALIAVAAAGAFLALGGSMNDKYETVGQKYEAANG